MKIKQKRSLPKILAFVALGTLIIASLVFAGYKVFGRDAEPPTTLTTADGQTVDLTSPSEAEKEQNDSIKDTIVADSKAEGNTPTGTTKSSLVISEKSSTGVSAYVTGIFEEGGTCMATAKLGSQTATGSSTGFQNVSYTQCAPITWDAPLTPGVWDIVVSYKSATTSSSQSTTIGI